MAKVDTLAIPNKLKDRYKVANWSEYNAGLKRRGSLTLWLDEPVAGSWYYREPKKRGGQFVYSASCIALLLTLKVTFCLAFRQLEGLANSVFDLMGT